MRRPFEYSILISMMLLALSFGGTALGQSSSFNYQGRLQDVGTNANGNYDFQFTLWDSVSGGTQQPQPTPVTVTKSSVTVVNGIFTVPLDFGVSAFPGADRFLETSVRLTGSGAFTLLSPRQPITSTPYAIRSATSGTADNASNATTLGGVAANNYLQSIVRNATLSGNGTSNSPLGVAAPLQLSGNLVVTGIVSGVNNSSTGGGVYGFTNDPGDGNGGVLGEAPNGDGIVGRGGRAGVFGLSSTGVGINGHGNSSVFAGVLGFNSNGGPGVEGLSATGKAIHGQSTNGFAGYFEGVSYFSGNVGIGTTTPVQKLHVVGDSNLVGNLTVSGGATASVMSAGNFFATAARISNTGLGLAPISTLDVVSSGGQAVLLGGGSATGSEVKFTNSGTAHFSIYNSGNSNLTFAQTSSLINTNTPGNPLMAITAGGNVGIGTTSPQAKLHVNGTIRMDVLGQPAGNSPLCLNTSNLISFCNTSSLRYKSNVKSFSGGLNIINRLRPITFDWKEGGMRDLGLAAEEVNQVEPLLAFRNNKGEVEGVKYNQLSAVFINAFKEQQTQIELQQEQIKRQQVEINELKRRATEQQTSQQQEINALRLLVCRSRRGARLCR